MAVTSACACCGDPMPGPLEWGWCAACERAGCIRLRSDAEGGDVRRGRECPLLQREIAAQARTVTTRGVPAPMHLPAARGEDDDTIVVDVDEVGR